MPGQKSGASCQNDLIVMIKKNFVRTLLLVAMLGAAGNVSAQVKQYNNELSEFHALEVKGEFEVSLVHGSSYNVLFTVDEAIIDYVECNIKNKTLIIEIDEKRIPKEVKSLYKGRNAAVATFKAMITMPEHPQLINMLDKTVLYDNMGAPSAREIKLVAGDKSSVKSFDVSAPLVSIVADKRSSIMSNISCEKLSLNMAGNCTATLNCSDVSEIEAVFDNSANVVVNGDVASLNLNAKSGSKSIFNGSASDAVFECSGSSNVNASNFKIEKSKVTMSSICQLSVNAVSTLDIDNLNGGAVLTIIGNPAVSIGTITKSSVNRIK